MDKRVQEKGFEGLLINNYEGKKSDLESHCDSILQSFQKQPPLTASKAAERIKNMTG